jgi:hypothetical protein
VTYYTPDPFPRKEGTKEVGTKALSDNDIYIMTFSNLRQRAFFEKCDKHRLQSHEVHPTTYTVAAHTKFGRPPLRDFGGRKDLNITH